MLTYLFNRLTQKPRFIVGDIKEYHLSEKTMESDPPVSPVSRQQIQAKKSFLTGKWNLYIRREYPARNSPGFMIVKPTLNKIDSGLSLKQVFDAVRRFENEAGAKKTYFYGAGQGAYSSYFHGIHGLAADSSLVVKVVKPANNENYWRNIKQKYPALSGF